MLRWFVSHKQWIWARIILALQANRLIIKCAGHFQTFSSRHFVSKFSLFETFDSFNMRNWKFCKNCKCNCVIFINTEYFSYFVSYFFFNSSHGGITEKIFEIKLNHGLTWSGNQRSLISRPSYLVSHSTETAVQRCY